jgi:hypothetical protein
MAGYAIMPEEKERGQRAEARADREVRTKPRRSESETRRARAEDRGKEAQTERARQPTTSSTGEMGEGEEKQDRANASHTRQGR